MSVKIPRECTEPISAPRIVCKEKGRTMTFLNGARRAVLRHKVDSCAELRHLLEDSHPGSQVRLCDYLVVEQNSTEHYVELKGKDVEHAVKQIESTIRHLWEGRVPIHCWIISSESPRISGFQKFANRLAKQFRAKLVIRTNAHECRLT